MVSSMVGHASIQQTLEYFREDDSEANRQILRNAAKRAENL
jgi:hypothetical protein